MATVRTARGPANSGMRNRGSAVPFRVLWLAAVLISVLVAHGARAESAEGHLVNAVPVAAAATADSGAWLAPEHSGHCEQPEHPGHPEHHSDELCVGPAAAGRRPGAAVPHSLGGLRLAATGTGPVRGVRGRPCRPSAIAQRNGFRGAAGLDSGRFRIAPLSMPPARPRAPLRRGGSLPEALCRSAFRCAFCSVLSSVVAPALVAVPAPVVAPALIAVAAPVAESASAAVPAH